MTIAVCRERKTSTQQHIVIINFPKKMTQLKKRKEKASFFIM